MQGHRGGTMKMDIELHMIFRYYKVSYLSSFADIDQKQRPENSCPSYCVNWEVSLFEDDVHDHV